MYVKVQPLSLVILLVALIDLDLRFAQAEDAEEEMKIEVLHLPEECQTKTKKFDQLTMHYTGTITATGAKFDSSHDRNQPFPFQLGTGQVIKGWDEGLLDMCVGEKRKLLIPASKAYGKQGAGDSIPPDSHLTFETELLSIEEGNPPPNVFKEIDTDEDKMLSQEEVSAFLKKQAENAGETDDSQHAEIVTEIFTHEDKDKDGFISHEEFSGPKHDEL